MSWALAGRMISKGAKSTLKGARGAARSTYKGMGKMSQGYKAGAGNMGWKGYAGAYALTGTMWGASAVMTNDPTNDIEGSSTHYGKYAVATGADIGIDLGLTLGANAIMGLGPLGLAAGAAIHAYNFLGAFAGIDPGTLALDAMDSMDGMYERASGRNSFRMTETIGKTMQKQLSNLQQSGTNVAEMMHN